MKAEEIVILVKECLDKLSKTGADMRLVTCDQGTCNQSAYSQLGVDSDMPFFVYNEKKYYASYDVAAHGNHKLRQRDFRETLARPAT